MFFVMSLENQLLLISINFTPKTSHSCLKKWYTRFSRSFLIISRLTTYLCVCVTFLMFSFRGRFSTSTNSHLQICWNHLTYICSTPIGSMYGIFTYIWLKCMIIVGKYTIHGSLGNGKSNVISHAKFWVFQRLYMAFLNPPVGFEIWATKVPDLKKTWNFTPKTMRL